MALCTTPFKGHNVNAATCFDKFHSVDDLRRENIRRADFYKDSVGKKKCIPTLIAKKTKRQKKLTGRTKEVKQSDEVACVVEEEANKDVQGGKKDIDEMSTDTESSKDNHVGDNLTLEMDLHKFKGDLWR